MNDYLIIGAGFLGRELMSWCHNARVTTVNRKIKKTKEHVLRFPKITALAHDVINEGHNEQTRSVISKFKGTMFCLLPPSAFGQDDVDGSISKLISFLEESCITRAILISSTGVYSESQGGKTVYDSCTSARDFRSERLLHIEERWNQSKWHSVIVRLAGIYGKERVVVRTLLSEKKSLNGTGKEWLNLIHVVDAARALVCIANARNPRAIYLLTDGSPLAREEYYEAIAQKYDLTGPLFNHDTSGSRSKFCDSSADWRSLGIAPIFTNAIALLKSDRVDNDFIAPDWTL